jgi:Copper type II ascorbate-dependent monooxygenase, C-terminal domain
MKWSFLASILLAPCLAFAQAPTWADDVACIVYSHCTSCHHPGGIASEQVNLTDYTAAYYNRDDIAAYTGYRIMPPWPPDPGYRRLAHERTLSQDEIDIIAAWANADGPSGDLANAPPVPIYSDNAVITDPDITAVMDEYVIPVSSSDLYRCFVLPINNPTNNWIKRLEVLPGNREVVHHVLVFQDTSGQAQVLDGADPGPGYTNFSDVGVASATLVGIWVPGSDVLSTPNGMGIKLLAGADLVIQVHYPAGSGPQSDSTRINIEFGTDLFTREIAITAPLEHLFTMTNGPLIIPPNEVRTFHNQYTTTIPATITAIGPHSHLICTSMKSWAITPAQDSIPLVSIPDWDFHWQGMYQFRRPIYLPIGTVLHGEATYDNTVNNDQNPNQSDPQWVFLGESTTNEMMLFYFAYTFGFASDTNIVVDNSAHTPHHFGCTTDFNIGLDETRIGSMVRIAPIPARDRVNVFCERNGGRLRIIDAQGREMLNTILSEGDNSVDVAVLGRGSAVAEVRNARGEVLHRCLLPLQ